MPSARAGLGALTLSIAALAAGGCGDDGDSTTEETFRPNATITVTAPTSLSQAFNNVSTADDLKTHMFFAGSDFHAEQIRGDDEKPDLIAVDDPALLDDLSGDGLVGEPVEFATDELVLAVPQDSNIAELSDLADPGVRVEIGHEGLPSGDYAREALGGLPANESQAILDNVTAEQPNNNAIVIALGDGKADAGFVYASDVVAANATGGKLKAIDLPAGTAPEVVYAGAVVEDAANEPGAQRFLDALTGERGTRQLETAGLGPAPAG
jgi:molybdate transport system substrate-binding protein